MNLFPLMFGALLCWISVYAIYFSFVRPVALTRFRFYLNEVEDELNMLLLSGKTLPDSESFLIVKSRLGRANAWLPHISVTTLLLAKTRRHVSTVTQVSEENATLKNADGAVQKLSNKLDIAMIGAFCVNSPFIFGLVVMLVLGVAMFSAIAKGCQTTITRLAWAVIYWADAPSKNGFVRRYA